MSTWAFGEELTRAISCTAIDREGPGRQPIPGAQVQEGPADEAVAGAEQLQHADFLASRLDVQAHGVADHQQRSEPQQRRQHPGHAIAEPEPAIQPLPPLGVVLHQIGFGQGTQ